MSVRKLLKSFDPCYELEMLNSVSVRREMFYIQILEKQTTTCGLASLISVSSLAFFEQGVLSLVRCFC